MSTVLNPFSMTDFRGGRISKSAVSPSLVPANSVANSFNVDFSEIIGSAVTRRGTRIKQQIISTGTITQSQTTNDSNTSQIFGANYFGQTFTVQTGQTQMLGIKMRLYRLGDPGFLTISIRATSAGLPTGADLSTTVYATTGITTSSSGAEYFILFAPLPTLTAGTVYSIVAKTSAGGASDYIVWQRNTAGGYANGQAVSSTNSGSTWSAITGEDFNFTLYSVASTYNLAPLGNYAFEVDNNDKSVVAYTDTVSTNGIMYYYNGSVWKKSLLDNMSINAPVRFAVLNGSIFMANGSDVMKSSVDFGLTWITTNCITTDSVRPSLLYVSKNRMLASGYSGFRSRVYFSSIVEPNSSPFIGWTTDPSVGDWIDINPDDGGIVTAFSDTSTLVLVFKTNAMYRINAITKTVDTENIFNVGAVSQEAVVKCLGMTYFYSGNGIYRTDGSFPEQISRLGVQDFLDAIANPEFQYAYQIFAGTDGYNVYFSIRNITIQLGPEDRRTYSNVVLKFSPRDQNWQIFLYPYTLGQFTQFSLSPNVEFQSAMYNGALERIQYLDPSFDSTIQATDDLAAINYSLETQELDFGNRAHTKVISDQIAVYTKSGGNGAIQVKPNDGDWKSAVMPLSDRINIGIQNNFRGNWFTVQWVGTTKGAQSVLQGIHITKITDEGVIGNAN
jgi:hypothetical protein